jgi:dipeptidase E
VDRDTQQEVFLFYSEQGYSYEAKGGRKNMPRLLLSGGGSAEDSRLLDQLLVQLTAKGRMLYVPIALDPHQMPYAPCYEWIRSVFTPLGLDRITMWSDLSAKTEADLNPFAALYIGGGNTYKLLHDLKQARFDQTIRIFLQHGGVVYGGSAGAIVCGRDISTASLLDRNDVGLEDTTGLDVLQGASVWCHYQPTDDQRIHSASKRLQHPIIALSEKTGVYVHDNIMLAVGFEPVAVFQHNVRRTFPPSSVVLIE